MTEFLTCVADALGTTVEIGAEAFEVEGQQLVSKTAQFVVRGLEEDLGLEGGEFSSWAIRTMGGAGQEFVKAWIRTNVEEEVWLLLGDEGEVFESHATPYLGSLVGY